MKNIILINHHATIPKYGGAGRHHQFSEELSMRGYNITLIASSYNHARSSYIHQENIREDIINDNYKFISIKSTPIYKGIKKRLVNYLNFTRKVKKLKFNKKPDVIIASSVHPFTWIAGYYLAKKNNAKFIVEVRDLWPLSLYEDLNKRIRPFIFKYFNHLERKYYNLANSIIVTAPNANKYITKKYNINDNKIFFTPHSIDLDYFDGNLTKKVPDNINHVLKSNFSITYTGSLSKSEGLENFFYLAKRFEKDKNISFIVVGSGEQKQFLINLKNKLKLKNLFMFESLPKESIPSILSESSILFCGLMRRKAFEYGISKNKFYDYMAAKKPIIFMSNVEGSAIENANCGYVIKDYSLDKAEEVIRELYTDKKLYNRLSENGRKYVELNHTKNVITNKLEMAMSYNN
ncbi:hypothetical protein CIL03_11320 [Virgibacillus indicus]|uniref:Glycosyltransferase WbuB n=1 Tax=Virgibacillus indicus TaxID=2024554 RepID=A0A265N8S4_9BACI|nr:glycosyltransferase family 4 protein [Virgibacillus indicus]OZU88237.1 hypothetical protein CIL03_11320 [Virgibacillus indicus]